MTRRFSKLSLGIAAVLVSASMAVAQTTPATPTTPAAPPAATKAPPAAVAPGKAATPAKAPATKTATTPWGIHCSGEADKQTLKGKEREKFRSKCIREYKKANPAPKAGSPAADKAAAPATVPAAPAKKN